MTQWNNTLKLKDVYDVDEETLTEIALQNMAAICAQRLTRFIKEQGERVHAQYWTEVRDDFVRLSQQKEVNADLFDSILDNLYDLADDDKVWIT